MNDAVDTLETCDECGFDAALWNDQDTVNTLGNAADLLHSWAEPVIKAGDDLVNARPGPGVWSTAEYIDHVRTALWGNRFLIDLARTEPGHDLGPLSVSDDPGEHRMLDIDECLAGVATEAAAIRSTLANMGDEEWGQSVIVNDEERTVRHLSRHVVHDLWHHLVDLGAIASTLGAASPPQTGAVSQLNSSTGGAPKTTVDSAEITSSGMAGDVQRTRRHHGRPWQALCLWSADVIDELALEGHPVHAGSAGENITVDGLDWMALHAGALVTIGDMTCRLSAPATPCVNIADSFVDRDFKRIDDDLHPGIGRWYAAVVTPGSIRSGDKVAITPPPPLF